MSKKIIKKNGSQEPFSAEKLCNSIVAAGAPTSLATQVCDIVSEKINSGTSTEKIFNITRKYLKPIDPELAALYSLERGLSSLGPSGFLFEHFVSELFRKMGYYSQKNMYLQGEAVEHEIDVMAQKGNVVFLVEAKYKNDFRTKTHIDKVMYADARLVDIRKKAQLNGDTREYYMWMVTNTQFTQNSLNYIEHRDLQLMGWDYPKFINLKKIVREKKLYPVTVVPSMTQSLLKKLALNDVVLVQDLYYVEAKDFEKDYGVSERTAKKLVKEVHELIHPEFVSL